MVQRYNPDYVMHAARFAPFARENEHGEFVKFSDYEALVSELASSRQINAQTLLVKLTMADTIKALKERVNALAVENSERGEIIERLIGIFTASGYHAMQNSYDPCSALLYDAFQAIRKPATSAALAAIEARGVEKFADRMLTLANDPTYSTASHRNDLRDAGAKAMNYAAALREAK
ncbi:hypothetical protein [Serratia marcescens]|uniref:hypothetical protein n=1 Tax=Serratia marcescens TaxID=615 RepID=UPI001BD3D6AD|nr:hypothetical protein [Serratia marcescens]